MKKILLTTLSLIIAMSFTQAQANMISNASFDEVSMSAYQIEIKIAPDRVIDLWDEFWDDRYDVDVDREDRNRDREIYMAKEVTVEKISDKQIDVYSSLTTTADDRTTVSLGFGVGYDVFANQERFSDIFAASERILNEFEAYSYQQYYGKTVEEWEEKLKDAKDEKSDLEQNISKNENQIERWQEKIKSLENDIQEARKENDAARQSIGEKTDKITSLEKELAVAKRMLSKWQ